MAYTVYPVTYIFTISLGTRVKSPVWLPEEDPRAAAACFQAEHDLMWEIASLSGLQGGNPVEKLADATVRIKIADIILAAREKDIQAAGHIERVLAQKGW
jgi:hypothetical protein